PHARKPKGATGVPRSPQTNGAADRIRTGDVQLGKLVGPDGIPRLCYADGDLALGASPVISRDLPGFWRRWPESMPEDARSPLVTRHLDSARSSSPSGPSNAAPCA